MVSGSNCCAPGTIHLFLRNANGALSARRDLSYSRPGSAFGFDRGHSRPHLLDWDRDGHTDLVIASSSGWWFEVCPGPLTDRGELQPRKFAFPNAPDTRPLEFDFADWDGDGGFDLLVTTQYLSAPKGPWVYAIDWLRNTAPRGEPVFAPPVRLLTVPAPWEINGFTVDKRDRSKPPNLVVGVTKDWKRNPDRGWTVDSQLWLYRRKS